MTNEQEARLRTMEANAYAFLIDIAEACRKHGLVIVNSYDSIVIDEYTSERLRDLFDLSVGRSGSFAYEGQYDEERERERQLGLWLTEQERNNGR